MNFENGFIKNEDLLLETSKVGDLLDLSSEISEFSRKLDKINSNSIFGVIGNFGEGKSTLINNVRIHREDDDAYKDYWIEFDAWKYPDRKNLWEGFVLDVAKQIDDDSFNKARKSIDGETDYDKETLMKTIGGALGVFVPGGNIVGNLSHFFRSSPAKRVFEIQEILTKLIEKVDSDKIVIVIEDIDRSGDNGIFFLETLKQFISSTDFGKQIIVIVPIGTKEYEKNLDSYLKPVDLFDFFNLKDPGLDKFIKEVFVDEITSKQELLGPLKDFLEGLFKYHSPDINIRKLKLILRKANHNHIVMHGVYDDIITLDWRLNIIFEASKYIKIQGGEESYFQNMIATKKVSQNSLFGAYTYNLFSFISSQKSYYSGDNKSILVSQYSQSERGYVNKFHKSPLTMQIINQDITEKGIVGLWYEIHELKKFTVPSVYLNY